MGYPEDAASIRDSIDSGELKWITLLLQNLDDAPPTVDDLAAWHSDFPHPHIDVVLVNGVEGDHWTFFSDNWQILGFPTIDLITPEFTWYSFQIFLIAPKGYHQLFAVHYEKSQDIPRSISSFHLLL